MPNALIIDCAHAEIGGLQSIWPEVKVFHWLWHVHCAWLKQAMAKYKDHEIQVAMLKGLGKILHDTNNP